MRYHHLQTAVERRDTIAAVVSGIPSPTEILEVVVFVDKSGQPARTATHVIILVPSTMTRIQPSSILAMPSMLSSADVAASIGPQSTSPVDVIPNQVPDLSTGASTEGGLQVEPTGVEGGGSTADAAGLPGVAYSQYNAYGTCKTVGRVYSDLYNIATQYRLVRIYGEDCGRVGTIVSAAKSTGLKLFLGIFNLDSLVQQTVELVNAVYDHGDWSIVDTVSVGNELVNNGQATAHQVINAVAATRQLLRSAGFNGPVVTVETFIAVLRNPWLCDHSDYCAINIHPFFDPNTPATLAGDFVHRQVAAVRNVLKNANQRIVVTETGWPWQGCPNGNAVPGKDNQKAAITSIKRVFGPGHSGNLILFSAFNDMWKKAEPSTFYAEQYWGISQF